MIHIKRKSFNSWRVCQTSKPSSTEVTPPSLIQAPTTEKVSPEAPEISPREVDDRSGAHGYVGDLHSHVPETCGKQTEQSQHRGANPSDALQVISPSRISENKSQKSSVPTAGPSQRKRLTCWPESNNEKNRMMLMIPVTRCFRNARKSAAPPAMGRPNLAANHPTLKPCRVGLPEPTQAPFRLHSIARHPSVSRLR